MHWHLWFHINQYDWWSRLLAYGIFSLVPGLFPAFHISFLSLLLPNEWINMYRNVHIVSFFSFRLWGFFFQSTAITATTGTGDGCSYTTAVLRSSHRRCNRENRLWCDDCFIIHLISHCRASWPKMNMYTWCAGAHYGVAIASFLRIERLTRRNREENCRNSRWPLSLDPSVREARFVCAAH